MACSTKAFKIYYLILGTLMVLLTSVKYVFNFSRMKEIEIYSLWAKYSSYLFACPWWPLIVLIPSLHNCTVCACV